MGEKRRRLLIQALVTGTAKDGFDRGCAVCHATCSCRAAGNPGRSGCRVNVSDIAYAGLDQGQR